MYNTLHVLMNSECQDFIKSLHKDWYPGQHHLWHLYEGTVGLIKWVSMYSYLFWFLRVGKVWCEFVFVHLGKLTSEVFWLKDFLSWMYLIMHSISLLVVDELKVYISSWHNLGSMLFLVTSVFVQHVNFYLLILDS